MTLLNRKNTIVLSVCVTAALLGAMVYAGTMTSQITTQQIDTTSSQNILPTSTSGGHYQVIPQAYADKLLSDAKSKGTLKQFTLVTSSGVITLPTGENVNIMTFNGTSPAPTLRVTQGDVVQVKVINVDEEPHSIDFHGGQLSAVPNFAAIAPHESRTLTFVAANPGVWAYHCEGDDVFELWEHPLKGMSGMLIVDPKNGFSGFTTNIVDQSSDDPTQWSYAPQAVSPEAREFSLVYGEAYLADAKVDGAHDFDQAKMFTKIPTYSLVNGVPFGYIGPLLTLPGWNGKTLQDVTTTTNLDGANPDLSALITEDSNGHTLATHLNVKTGEHARFFVQNNGDNEVAFHIVGEQLDQVSVGNNVMAHNVQTWGIPSYGDAMVDVVFENPGVYAIVNHDYSQLFKGHASIVVVGDGGDNPSNAVPPMSELQGTSIPQTTCQYGIGPDNQYGTVTGDEGSFDGNPDSDTNTLISECAT